MLHWLTLLGLAVVIAGLAAVTAIKPKGGRPVARTRLMSVARVILGLIAAILLVAAARALVVGPS